ncbi:conserved hypothetical protein, partial [Trichinella spiralis]
MLLRSRTLLGGYNKYALKRPAA